MCRHIRWERNIRLWRYWVHVWLTRDYPDDCSDCRARSSLMPTGGSVETRG